MYLYFVSYFVVQTFLKCALNILHYSIFYYVNESSYSRDFGRSSFLVKRSYKSKRFLNKMVKARLHFTSEASPIDPKSNTVIFRFIEVDSKIYIVPKEFQDIKLHQSLIELPTVKKCIASFKKRNQKRSLVVDFVQPLSALYFDDQENPCLFDEYLEETSFTEVVPKSTPELIGESSIGKSPKSLQSLTKDFVLHKFDGRSYNARTWINLFQLECERFQIAEPRYVEALRLFLDGHATTWFENRYLTRALSPWNEWYESFQTTFASFGWADVSHSYMFSYLSGSYVEYALRKIKLLLSVNPKIKVQTQIDLVVLGLPVWLRDKIDREEIESTDELMSELGKLSKPRTTLNNNNNTNNNKGRTQNEKAQQNRNENRSDFNRFSPNHKPCPFCTKIGKPGRYHPEEVCKTKLNSQGKNLNNFKSVNNTDLENELNNTITEQKNSI